jgi:hypothetical protein
VPDGKGVAIFSTVARLNNAFMIGGDYIAASQLGRVQYVDFEKTDFPVHIALDSGNRSFLKHLSYESEHELRLTTLNVVTPGCLNPDGTPCSEDQKTGRGSYMPDRKGIFVRCALRGLFTKVVVSPSAPPPFADLVRRLAKRYKLSQPIECSPLTES